MGGAALPGGGGARPGAEAEAEAEAGRSRSEAGVAGYTGAGGRPGAGGTAGRSSEARALTVVVVCAGKVGMRYFHKKGNLYFCPTVNLDKIWTLVGDDVRKAHASKTDVAPVIDVTKFVRPRPRPHARLPARPPAVA